MLTDTYPIPLNDDALCATWHAAWASLGRNAASTAPAGLREELLTAWSEPHRCYHVMATQHGLTQEPAPAALRSNLDAKLLIDIDLSILGSPPERFERFERYDRNVRKEYAWVPGLRYQQARARVPQTFLDRPRIFHAEPAVALLKVQARTNLVAALSRLAQ